MEGKTTNQLGKRNRGRNSSASSAKGYPTTSGRGGTPKASATSLANIAESIAKTPEPNAPETFLGHLARGAEAAFEILPEILAFL
jgi:hypothetical protein